MSPEDHLEPDVNVSELGEEREVSGIPRYNSGDSERWIYPSHGMFYRALKKKGKPVPAENIAEMVSIHNRMNDAVWEQIMAIEKRLCPRCDIPALIRFRGRPFDLSPTAFWHVFVRGGVPPFDRHDWVVSRKYPDVLVEDGNKLMQSEVSNPTELINSPYDDSVNSKSEKITESHHLIPEKFESRDTLNTVNSEATINYTRSTIKSVNGDVGESSCGRGSNSDYNDLRKSDELSMGITCANNKDKLVGKIDYEISDSRKMVREVRYVIDYYGGSKDEGHSTFYIHTRPAIDGVRSMIDRLRLWLDRFLQ